MFVRLSLLWCLAIMLLVPSRLFGQQLREQDQTPFEAPKALCTLKLGDLDKAIQAVSKVLTTAGFALDSASDDSGQIIARKTQGNGENRLLVWLERDLVRPTERFRVYMLVGRYEPFFGSPDLKRALISDAELQQRFGPIRSAVVARCSQGN